MKWLLSILFFSTFICVSQLNAVVQSSTVEVSFSAPYPVSPFARIKSLATKLWSEVQASLEDRSVRDTLEETIGDFAHAVLDLNTLCDVLVADVTAQMHGMSVRYEGKDMYHIFEEVQYLLGLIRSLESNFDTSMTGHISDQAACVKIVFNRISKKMERMLAAFAP